MDVPSFTSETLIVKQKALDRLPQKPGLANEGIASGVPAFLCTFLQITDLAAVNALALESAKKFCVP
jgi:hypothetical protein